LSFKDTDLRDVFRALSIQNGLNIFLDNSITKRVTVSLSKVRVYDALKFLSEQNSLLLTLDGGIFKVTPPPPPRAPVPPPPRVPAVSFEKGLLSVILKGDELESVIAELQKKTGKNILTISGTTGTLSGRLMDVDFDIGFTQIFNNNGFAVQKKNGIYLVSRLDHFVGTQGSASREQTGPYWISVKDSLVTIDVTNAPLDRVLPDLIRQRNTDVVFYNQPTGSVTARTTGVHLERALDLILRNTPYTYKETDGVYFIGEKSNKALNSTRLLKLKYLRAEQVMEWIPQSLATQATIKASKEHNGFIVIAPTDVVEQMKEYLDQVDKPIAQVLIEALVVDYDVSEGSELGIQAGLGGSQDTIGFNRTGTLVPQIDMKMNGTAVNRVLEHIGKFKVFGTELDFASLGKLPKDFYLNLKALEKEGLANVKSRPIIATVNGHKATLSVGTTQYFLLKTTTPYRDQNQVLLQESQAFQTIEADVKLEITPYVGSEGTISLDIKPDFQTPVGQLSPDIPPTISKRTMSSTLIVKEGETVVLGGLVQESETETSTQVPILGSIPLLGKLFSSTVKSKRKAELMIYITPHISYGEPFKTAYEMNPD
jgi:type IV pilus assembly protein PilQ